MVPSSPITEIPPPDKSSSSPIEYIVFSGATNLAECFAIYAAISFGSVLVLISEKVACKFIVIKPGHAALSAPIEVIFESFPNFTPLTKK